MEGWDAQWSSIETESNEGSQNDGDTRSTRKEVKSTPSEEPSPERRVEIAPQIEAKQFRGKAPSI
jgi:hypothetical protein